MVSWVDFGPHPLIPLQRVISRIEQEIINIQEVTPSVFFLNGGIFFAGMAQYLFFYTYALGGF